MMTGDMKSSVCKNVVAEIKARNIKVAPRSGALNPTKMYKLMDTVAAMLKVAEVENPDARVQDVLMHDLEHVAASWRGYDENAKYLVDRWLQSDCPPWQTGSCNNTGKGDNGTPGKGEGQNGDNDGQNNRGQNSDGEGQNGEGDGGQNGRDKDSGEGDGDHKPSDDESDEEGEDGDGWGGQGDGEEGEDDKESKEGNGDYPPIPPIPPEPQEDEEEEESDNSIPPEDMPDDPNYQPPKIWEKCVKIIRWNLAHPGEQKNVMLVGLKGIGKTRLVMELSKKFFACAPEILTSPQMEHKVVGFNNAMGEEVKTPVTRGYVKPGIILIDEFDRSDANSLIALNAATANKIMDAPSGNIRQSDLCTFFATANTSGTGATVEYNTANQLDASTRDRWIYLLMEWDHEVALKVARGDIGLVTGLEMWNDACDKTSMPQGVVSYRTITDILDLVDMGCFTFKEAVQAAMLKYGMCKSAIETVLNEVPDKRNKVISTISEICDKMPDTDASF